MSKTVPREPPTFPPPAIVVMGVSGSGKTTVGTALAEQLDSRFYDADDYHTTENIAKMSAGVPLTDADRAPWLDRLNRLIGENLANGEPLVLACSALKTRYRERLRRGNPGVVFLYLQADFEAVWLRMRRRKEHYMKAEMLRSQYADLEEPAPSEAIVIPATGDLPQILEKIITALAGIRK